MQNFLKDCLGKLLRETLENFLKKLTIFWRTCGRGSWWNACKFSIVIPREISESIQGEISEEAQGKKSPSEKFVESFLGGTLDEFLKKKIIEESLNQSVQNVSKNFKINFWRNPRKNITVTENGETSEGIPWRNFFYWIPRRFYERINPWFF